MKSTENLIKAFCQCETNHKELIGRKCIIKRELMEEGLKGNCKPHFELCAGELTIVETQLNWKGQLAVRVQNEKIKNLHPGAGDFLNSFIKAVDEIELI